MDKIQQLPDSVANQIAAGEVIQRPASVVKELVENAIDAGATEIQIVLKDAGRTLIQVIDNGAGMSATDARMAFERHATSKIRNAQDLFNLYTMGFRGEALASIAAIAQVSLRTRREEDEMGTEIILSGSTIEKQDFIVCNVGSNFAIKNLFYNVPARRKFLKSNATELNNILTECDRVALINPQIEFSIIHNDNLLHQLPKANLKQRIISLFGKSLNEQLLPIEVETSLVTVGGFIGTPANARKRGALQFFFVNGRYMRHPYFHKAIMHCYEQLIPVGEMPNYFITLVVEPSSIDVNIHPTKTEIKFENEQAIWQIIAASIRETLGKSNSIPSIDFDMEDAPEIPVYNANREIKNPISVANPYYNPFQEQKKEYPDRPTYDWATLYKGFENTNEQPQTANQEPEQTTISLNEVATTPLNNNSSTPNNTTQYLQIKGRYIVTNLKSGLALIDQHRAHIRVLYEQYLGYIDHQSGVIQGVLFPEILYVTAAQDATLQSILEELFYVGFDLSPLGNYAYSINGVPAGTEGIDSIAVIINMIENATEKGCSIKSELHHTLALTLAQHGAIPYNQQLSSLEIDNLVAALFSTSMSQITPDGKPIVSILTNEEIAKRFKN